MEIRGVLQHSGERWKYCRKGFIRKYRGKALDALTDLMALRTGWNSILTLTDLMALRTGWNSILKGKSLVWIHWEWYLAITQSEKSSMACFLVENHWDGTTSPVLLVKALGRCFLYALNLWLDKKLYAFYDLSKFIMGTFFAKNATTLTILHNAFQMIQWRIIQWSLSIPVHYSPSFFFSLILPLPVQHTMWTAVLQ